MDQLALFEDLSAPKSYVPKQEHVINRLRHILAQLQAAPAWPWDPVIVKLYKESTLPQLYGLVADEAQAESFRNLIGEEIARFDRDVAQAA
jgi:hypothetical protein